MRDFDEVDSLIAAYAAPTRMGESRTQIFSQDNRWTVAVKILASSFGLTFFRARESLRFSFCRYDRTQGNPTPVLSSTSNYTVCDFHWQDSWKTLELVDQQRPLLPVWEKGCMPGSFWHYFGMAKKAEPLPPPPEPYYDLRRWMDDWHWFTDPAQEAGSESDFAAYFAEKYGEYASYFQARLGAALAYKREHIDPMEASEEKTLASGDQLMAALYRLYSRSPDENLGDVYPTGLVVALSKQHKPRH